MIYSAHYITGAKLVLKLPSGGATTATVLTAFTPFTLSPVLRVSLQPGFGPSSEAILKLHDRRCLVNTREEYGDTPVYTPEREILYREYLDALSRGDANPCNFDDLGVEHEFTDGEFEAYLAHTARKLYHAELSTYERLKSLQGSRIPRFYSAVSYEDGLDVIQGILIEFVPSISLRSFISHNPPFPHEVIAQVCDDAISLIHHLSDALVLNEDVRLDNVLVRTSNRRCILIDLTHCRSRRDDESEADWVAVKWSQDEEGAIGHVATRVIKEALGSKVWVYKPSLRFCRPLPSVSSHFCQPSGSNLHHSNILSQSTMQVTLVRHT